MLSKMIIITLLLTPHLHAANDITIADFESGNYDGWKVEGTAFGQTPATGTFGSQRKVSGFEGKWLVNSYTNQDGPTGKMTSSPFTIQKKYINFLIGGGNHPKQTCINLIINGKVTNSATGRDNEKLNWATWDVSKHKGKEAVIQIVDQHSGGWGHINIDSINMSDSAYIRDDATRSLKLNKRYINLPVRTGNQKRRMKMLIDGKIIREFDIEYAEKDPQFWVFIDVSDFQGKEAILQLPLLKESLDNVLCNIELSNKIKEHDIIYKEKYRSQTHFSTKRGWINDPNGLVYHKGVYHLYYQHNPYGWKWGNMHWGHATSTDLIHWTQHPIAVYPKRYGDWAYSGGALVDHKNTAGFQKGPDAPIIAFYTSTGRGECVLYSNDGGMTFEEYEGNPVVKHRGRDPKVIWHEKSQHWVMAVYDDGRAENKKRIQTIQFYTSENLKDWTYQSEIEGFYECPEIFELAVDGNKNNRKWIVYAGNGDYRVGTFDGKKFSPETEKIKFNYGNGFYASQTFSDIPAEDGRRIQIAWGRTGKPGTAFNSIMLMPVSLTLKTTNKGIRMFAEPVEEIRKIYNRAICRKNIKLSPDEPLSIKTEALSLDFETEISIKEDIILNFDISGAAFTYNSTEEKLSFDKGSCPVKPVNGKIKFRMIVDAVTTEIFCNDGQVYMTSCQIPEFENKTVKITSKSGTAVIDKIIVNELDSIWK